MSAYFSFFDYDLVSLQGMHQTTDIWRKIIKPILSFSAVLQCNSAAMGNMWPFLRSGLQSSKFGYHDLQALPLLQSHAFKYAYGYFLVIMVSEYMKLL